MSKQDLKFIEPLKKLLPWRSYRKTPVGGMRIVVIYRDGTIDCDYAINFALFWGSRFINKWCYYDDVIKKRII